MAEKIRLQKMIADCGIASRRKAEQLIEEGKVRVNGRVAQIGDKVDPASDKVTVGSRKLVPQNSRKVYIMLHKPRGFVTTMDDELGRKCVAELVDNVEERVFPVGRLDRDSEGLLLMTNDGDFANRISHPRSHVSKTYRVTVRQQVTEDMLARLSEGLMIDGQMTLPADVNLVTKEENRCVMQITLYEGRNRQIRKMCEELGLDVIRLKRTAVGNVRLGMLKQGEWRDLSDDELRSLMASAQISAARQKRAAKAAEKAVYKPYKNNKKNNRQGRN